MIIPTTFDPGTPTGDVLAQVLGGRPRVHDSLVAAHDAAWAATDQFLLDLCRLRIATLLGNAAESAVRTADGLDEATVDELPSWPTSRRFGARERACLALCEQWILDVGAVTREQTDAVAREIGVQGLADLVSALLVIEQRQRLRLAWERLYAS